MGDYIGAVQTVEMGRPDGQLCGQNSEIFIENISCLRAESERSGTVVWTVARPLQVISLLRLRAFRPWGWPSGRLIFYTQFPYLLSARPDLGRLASGRLNLNCDSCLMGERVQTGIHIVRTVVAIFPYLNLERKSEA